MQMNRFLLTLCSFVAITDRSNGFVVRDSRFAISGKAAGRMQSLVLRSSANEATDFPDRVVVPPDANRDTTNTTTTAQVSEILAPSAEAVTSTADVKQMSVNGQPSADNWNPASTSDLAATSSSEAPEKQTVELQEVKDLIPKAAAVEDAVSTEIALDIDTKAASFDSSEKLFDAAATTNGRISEVRKVNIPDTYAVSKEENEMYASPNVQPSSVAVKEFVNEGLFAWMDPFLALMGVEEGKSLTYGVLAVDLDESNSTYSAEEALKMRQKAAEELINIGPQERARRDKAGSLMLAATALYIVWASLFADDGGIAGHILRFLAAYPLFLAIGYKRSAEYGLCNIAQAGLWEVDGAGLTKIEDTDVASAILKRVNDMNIETAITVFIPMLFFASLPQHTSSALVSTTLLFAALYFAEGKIPKPTS